MSPRSSLSKLAFVPLLAVAAAAALCAPARAVTVSWTKCQADSSPKIIDGSVDCNFTGDATMVGVGDYYDPSQQNYYYRFGVAGGGTYNCWCICSGTDYYGNAFAVSTGGTTYVSL